MKLYQVDSFTDQIFKGNPAGVYIVEGELSDDQMQSLAIEMNLSETAFVKFASGSFDLRWFTPAREVPLCGHATLASAFVLFEEGFHPTDQPIVFNTLSGKLIVTKNQDETFSMDFPASIPSSSDMAIDKLEEVFGGKVQEVLTVQGELIVIFDELSTLLNIAPNTDNIADLAENGVIVSAWSGGEAYDFASRYFAPNLGIKEDPVTGFMHTILTPYWAKQKDESMFKAYQASARSGELLLELKGDRVIITGKAVKVFETTFKF